MENASKALIISGAILIVVMILTLVMMFYNDVSDYYQTESDSAIVAQTVEFNKIYENYHRNQIRGTDMISLMNRIIDYNKTQTYQAGTNYKRIEVNINLQNNNVIEQFKYPSSLIDSIIDDIVITNRTTGTTTLEDADNSLIAITDVENELLIELSNLGVSNPNSSQLQSLTANIANIIIEDSITDSNWIIGSQQIMNRQKRADLIKSVLNIDINFRDEKNAIAERTSQDVIDELKEIVLKYYQFMQFKRAYFDCTEVKYDKNTGRICEMNFEIRTDSSGNVEFN